MTNRSHTKRIRFISFFAAEVFIETTLVSCVILSLTNMFALTPVFCNAFSRRLAATAAPPVRSDVFIRRMRMIVLFIRIQ